MDQKQFEEEIKKLKEENAQLKGELVAIRNCRTWIYASKIKDFARKLGLIKLIKLLRGNKQEIIQEYIPNKEFDYEHMLNGYEFRFYNYKKKRNEKYSLDITDIKVPYQKDLVSIVLPVYNGEDYVALSIDSVLKQTYKNFEFIIINDGSKDGTANILDEYAKKDERIKVIHQDNMKLPKTLSKGFRMARGEYFTWTSADNIMHEDFLEKFLKEFKKSPHISMLFANMRLIDENGNPIITNEWYANPEHHEDVYFPWSNLELNTMANNYIGAAFMYRAVTANIVYDYSAYKYCTEDYDYWMKINGLLELRHVEFLESIYSYRFHSQSLTSRDKELKITENRYKLMLLEDFRQDYYLTPLTWVFEDAEADIVMDLKEYVMKNGDKILTEKDAKKINNSKYELIVYVHTSNNIKCENQKGFHVLLVEKKCSVDVESLDCCICTNDNVTEIDYLSNYVGWFGIKKTDTIFSFIDSKAKMKALYEMEAEMDVADINYNYLYSIIIPYSGSRDDLNQCLASLSTIHNIEIIVVVSKKYLNDITDLEGKKIHIVLSNFTDAASLYNVGAWTASGEYIIFAECNYLFHEKYFDNIIKKFKDNSNIQAVTVTLKECDSILQKYVSLDEKKVLCVRNSEFKLIGGIYHLANDECKVISNQLIKQFIQIIEKRNSGRIKEIEDCHLNSHYTNYPVDCAIIQYNNQILGKYHAQTRMIETYDTWPEQLNYSLYLYEQKLQCAEKIDAYLIAEKENTEKLLMEVRNDFINKADCERIRNQSMELF